MIKKHLLTFAITSAIFAALFGAITAFAAPIYHLDRTIIPETNLTYDLGTSTSLWRNIYTNRLCIDTDCRTAWPSSGLSFGYPFALTGNATSTLTQFNGGLTAFASSTIGNTLQAGGLTINGGATTTGNARINGTLTQIGTVSLFNGAFTVNNNGATLSSASFTGPNGGTGSPSFKFAGSSNSGFYQAATDQIGITINNVEEARFNATGLGLGTTTPWGKLSASSTSAFPTLAIEQHSTGPAATFLGGNVGIGSTSPWKTVSIGSNNAGSFAIATTTTGCAQFGLGGELFSTGTNCGSGSGGSSLIATSSSETSGYFPVWTSTNGTPALLAGTSQIFQSGSNVGVGSTSPSFPLSVTGQTYIGPAGLASGSLGTTLNTYTTDLNANVIGNSFQSVGSLNTGGNSQALQFNVTDNGVLSPATLTGLNGLSTKTLGGNITTLTGIQASARISGTTTAGTVNGFVSQIRVQTGTTATNVNNFNATAGTVTGTIGSSYGFHAAAQKVSGVTTGYGFASDGASDLNYVMGLLGAGTSTPSTQLSVQGNALVSGTSFFGGAITATSTLTLSALGTPAGSFLAVDPTGKLIATTSPSAGGITSLNGLTASTQAFATTSSNGGWGFTSSGSTHTLNIPTASASNPLGLLSSTDWSTFNGKQAAGNYLTALTGDITASGPGSAAATLATVNSNVGTFTYPSVTVNGKGLITAISNGSAPTTYTGTYPISVSGSVISTAFGTTTNWGIGNNGFVVTGATGIPYSVASSTLSLPNTALQNSTISGKALGTSLEALTATNGSLTFSGSYDGSTARTVGINLANANTWSALQQFSNASSTLASITTKAYFGTNSTTTIDNTGITVPSASNVTIANLGTAAGTFVAADPNGKLIATSSPAASFTGSSLLGSGVDGATTYNGTVNLTSDVYATTVTVNGTVFTNGWRIFATGAVTVANGGKISVEGKRGVDGPSGIGVGGGAGGLGATSTGMLGSGTGGQAGFSTNTGGTTSGVKNVDTLGGSGGAGGSSGATGQISPGGFASSTLARFLDVGSALALTANSTSTNNGIGGIVRVNGGAGGGGGGGGNGNNGGGGGGGGGAGVLQIVAQSITVNSGGTISAIGGAGGDGGTSNGGGGGGGGGGAIVLLYTGTYTNNGSVSANGGAGGNSPGGSGAPSAGSNGKVITMKIQ